MANKSEILSEGIQIRWPLAWIIGAGLLVYIRSIGFGFTDLDDRILIIENKDLLRSLSNLPSLFKRGVFNESQDVYYRPVLMLSLMMDAQVAGISPKFYHAMNVFLHLLSACLFYLLLMKLKIRDYAMAGLAAGHNITINNLTAFLLTLIFVVHPVLTQAVVWIPGRNDTLLAVFALISLFFFIKYLDEDKLQYIVLHVVFLFIAFLTKETSIVIPLVCLAYFVFIETERKPISKWIFIISGWLTVLSVWYILRSFYTVSKPRVMAGVLSGLDLKIKVFLGYLGKIFLPYNLSVFPIAEDTSVISGIFALLLLSGIIYFSKNRNRKAIFFGFSWFLLFLLPVLIIPQDVNDQNYEHRLYLPLMGILMVLSYTLLFNNSGYKTIIASSLLVILIFTVINFKQAEKFRSEMVFWKNAVKDSPHSSYALVRLGSRYYTTNKKENAEQSFASALVLNPEERYANYYLGKIYLEKGKVAEAYKLLIKEELLYPGYADNLFELAHACFMLDKKKDARKYLIKYAELRPDDTQAHNNLYLLYLEMNNYPEALKEARHLKSLGAPDADQMIAEVQRKQEESLKIQK
jgi:protein O-mannosyl-transferase